MKSKQRIGFERYYEELFPERWPALKEALLAVPAMVSLEAGLRKPYFLDMASVVAASALEVCPGERVLDLCAAPGGKSLILARAAGTSGSLTANDRSADRRARLRRVLADHLPPELLARVLVTGHDAARWGLHEQGLYDRVLADVPCSSERHLVGAPQLTARWSPARTRHLAIQAYAILASGVQAAKAGGTVVYATCALSPRENDEVIAKLVDRRSAEVTVEEPSALAARLFDPVAGALRAAVALTTGVPPPRVDPEITRFGLQIWPDRANGMGPIYFAQIGKRAG